VDGDGEGVCETSGALVEVLDDRVRVAMKAVREIRQIVLHILIRWKLGICWVAEERITMARQKSEIGLETVKVMRGDSRSRYIVRLPRERWNPQPTAPSLIFPGKMNMVTRFINQNPQKDVAVVTAQTRDRP